MRSAQPYFQEFPKDFQSGVVSQIFKSVKRGENIQLVGLKGSGKSLIMRYLTSKPSKLNEFDVHYFDLSLLPEISSKEILAVMSEALMELEGKHKALFLFDNFETIIEFGENRIVDLFKSIYEANRDYVTMVFSMERPIDIPDKLFGRTCFVEPLKGVDLEWFWQGVLKSWDRRIRKSDKEKIVSASGGYIAVLKRLMEAVMEGEDVDRLIGDPGRNPHLLYQLELIREGLRGRKNYFEVPIFETFLNLVKSKENIVESVGELKLNAKLTSLEYKVLKNLFDNHDLIVSRDDSIIAAWGGDAVGIAEHALDQIIYRLNKKLKDSKCGVRVETVKGRGHTLREI